MVTIIKVALTLLSIVVVWGMWSIFKGSIRIRKEELRNQIDINQADFERTVCSAFEPEVKIYGALMIREDPVTEKQVGKEYTIDKERYRIGRADDNDLILQDKMVSRYHAVIETINCKVVIRDLHSTNGVFLDGIRIENNNPYELKQGSLISLGEYVFEFIPAG